MTVLQAAVSGVLVGALYALMAVGLSLMWGTLRVINLAHFGLILLGGYLTYELATTTGVNPILTIVVSAPALAIAGAAMQWVFERFRVSEFNTLLLSFGVLIITVQVVTNVWTADFRRMDADVNPYATRSVPLGDLAFPTANLLAFAFAVVLVLGTEVALRRTFAGRALRAFAHDRAIAGAFGINGGRLGLVLAAAAGASAAVAGMLFALGSSLSPTTPFEWIGIVFAVVILGGIGQVAGTLAAGTVTGAIAGVVSVVWSPAASPLVLFSIIVLALLFRPTGLFTRARA